jgi:23S rRNA pseudouridine1911/1915/1917 synthase
MNILEEIKLKVDSENPVTLRNFLTSQGISHRLLTKLKRLDGGITRNGEFIRSIDTVYSGDIITLKMQDSSFLEPNPDLYVPVVFENENAVIFDKPSGMPVHPSAKHRLDTLGNYFAYAFSGLTFRPVNRLDRDTSGLCVIAKNSHAANLLNGHCDKVYYAAVHGVTDDSGTIDAPISRQQESVITRCVNSNGRRAVTHYRKIAGNSEYSLEEIHLETGRTHQIRVHFSYIGHPLAGDDMYGGMMKHISRQALHCGEMTFTEPLTGEKITVTSPIPNDIMSLFSERI